MNKDKIEVFRSEIKLHGVDARTTLKKKGYIISPVGTSNSKTGTIGTYRKVVDTCPLDCSLMKECYAKQGNVGIHEKRAVQGIEADVNAFLLASLLSEQTNIPVRMHVSGDFYKDDKIEEEYVDSIADILKQVKATVWTYTHRDDEYLDKIKDKVHIRYSDKGGPNGAIVVDNLKDYKLKIGQFKCPNDLDPTIKCSNCKLCWTVESTVVFQNKSLKKRGQRGNSKQVASKG